METEDDLIERLTATQGDVQAQAALMAEFRLAVCPEPERQVLREALDAAAVLHWFDAGLLALVLEIPEAEARDRFEQLKGLTFVEPYGRPDLGLLNVHEATRLGWRRRLVAENLALFCDLSARAATYFAKDLTPASRIQHVYHLSGVDPRLGFSGLNRVVNEWAASGRPEDRSALSRVINELVSTGLVSDRASTLSWDTCGGPLAEQLRSAIDAPGNQAETDTSILRCDITQAQLEVAQVAFAEALRHSVERDWSEDITRRLEAPRVAPSRASMVNRQDTRQKTDHAPGEILTSTRQVLVVEDDPLFQRDIGESIVQLGTHWLVHAFRTGIEAIHFRKEPAARVDLARVDFPADVSGVEVVQAIHSRFPRAPIMVISVVSAESTVLAAIRAGASGYILKGDSSISMARAIEQRLDGNYPISPKLARYLLKPAGSRPAVGCPDPPRLTTKETELLQLIASGKSYSQAADAMGVALSTVRPCIRDLYRKLDAKSQTQAPSESSRAECLTRA